MDPIPSIAEKVRFWQEQDQINQALIPRVVKLHETVVDLSRQLEETPTVLAAVESRLRNQLVDEKEKLTAHARQIEQRMDQHAVGLGTLQDELTAQVGSLRQGVERCGAVASDLAGRLDEQSAGVKNLWQQMVGELGKLHEDLTEQAKLADAEQSASLIALEARIAAQEVALKACREDANALLANITQSQSSIAALTAELRASTSAGVAHLAVRRDPSNEVVKSRPTALMALGISFIALALAVLALVVVYVK